MIGLVLSIEITLSKNSYYPEETLQAEITGNFVYLNLENTVIYEEGIPRITPVISDLIKHGDKYYYYAVLPNKEGNFSFVIENTEYITAGQLKKEKIIRNFTIKKGNQTYLSINPGFVFTRDDDFSIKIKSPIKNQNIIATLLATNQSKYTSLIEQEEKTVKFSIKGLGIKRTDLKIENYYIPVFILSSSIPIEQQELIFSPEELKATITPGQNYFFKISLENFGNKNITDIKLLSNLNAVFSPEIIPLLKKGEVRVIDVTIPVSANARNNLSGEISARYNSIVKTLNVFFEITQNTSNINLNGTTVTRGLSCNGRGKICVYPETCTSQTTESLEGPCCLGECEQQTQADYSWIFGVILLIVLALIAFYLVKRARRKRPKSSEEILDEKTKRFNQRMNLPEKSSEEVSGKLGRV